MHTIAKATTVAIALLLPGSADAQSNYEVNAVKRLNMPSDKRMDVLRAMTAIGWVMVAADKCPAVTPGRLSLRAGPRFAVNREVMRQVLSDVGLPESEFDSEAFKDLVIASYARVFDRDYYGYSGAFCLNADLRYGPSGGGPHMLTYPKAE